jgi:hypothetical protein
MKKVLLVVVVLGSGWALGWISRERYEPEYPGHFEAVTTSRADRFLISYPTPNGPTQRRLVRLVKVPLDKMPKDENGFPIVGPEHWAIDDGTRTHYARLIED